VLIRSIWGYWRGTFPLVSCANTAALKRAGITRDMASPAVTLTIEKDANGDPTGVFLEREMQPIAELIWFREATQFTHADRLRAPAAPYTGWAGFNYGHGLPREQVKTCCSSAHRTTSAR